MEMVSVWDIILTDINVNTTNFRGGGRGITIQNSTVTVENCWFSNENIDNKCNNIKNLTFTISATDLPRGAYFDAESGSFSWTPGASQTGETKVTFTATDCWGASSNLEVQITVDAGMYQTVDVSATEDVYLASWKDEKNKNYAGNEYLRMRRMPGSASDEGKYGLFGEKITSTSDSNDAKISVLKFDAAALKENLKNLEKAELELTLINRRNNSSTGTDRLLVTAVTSAWAEANVTWRNSNSDPVTETGTDFQRNIRQNRNYRLHRKHNKRNGNQ